MNYAIGFGINDYPGTNMDLSGCVNDVKDVIAELKTKWDFTISKTLLDSKATKAAILKTLEEEVVARVPGDILVVWYSGHGTYVPDTSGDEKSGNDQCWVPYDIMTNGPIIDDQIYATLRKKKTGVKIIVFSDSCFSGTVLRAFSPTFGGKGKAKFLPPSKFLKPALTSRMKKDDLTTENIVDDEQISKDVGGTLMLFSGCQDDQTSADAHIDGRYNGAFTYFALKALREMNKDSTYKQWFKKIRTYLPSSDYEQAPNLYGAGMMSKLFS